MEHPRPLAGLPPADPTGVARAWLVRRIAAAPLADAPALATPGFAERAPALCGSLLAALADDDALAVLPDAGAVLAALVAGEWEQRARAGSADGRVLAAAEQLRAAAAAVALPGVDPALHAALQDRLAHACSRLAQGALAARPREPIVVRDARPGPEPRALLTAEAERLALAGVAFALLAVEIEDAALVPAGVLAAAERALHAALPPDAVHAPDGPGSLLVLARDADGRALARALTRAVGSAASHRGAPLRAAAGVAQHPEDGDTPESLLARADGQLFAARAEGLPLA